MPRKGDMGRPRPCFQRTLSIRRRFWGDGSDGSHDPVWDCGAGAGASALPRRGTSFVRALTIREAQWENGAPRASRRSWRSWPCSCVRPDEDRSDRPGRGARSRIRAGNDRPAHGDVFVVSLEMGESHARNEKWAPLMALLLGVFFSALSDATPPSPDIPSLVARGSARERSMSIKILLKRSCRRPARASELLREADVCV